MFSVLTLILLESALKTPSNTVYLPYLTAGHDCMRVFFISQQIKYKLLNVLEIKRDIKQQDLKKKINH